jgi:hypothetical protein
MRNLKAIFFFQYHVPTSERSELKKNKGLTEKDVKATLDFLCCLMSLESLSVLWEAVGGE